MQLKPHYRLLALLILASAGCARHVEAPRNWRAAVTEHVASGDTSAALAVLDSVVAVYPRDAAAWNRMGMLAWAKARPGWHGRVFQSRPQISMMMRADSALRLAHAYGPDSARYALDLGRFFLFGDLITLRAQAIGRFEHAIRAARRAGDSSLVSEAADELGMAFWRRYEAVANRRLISSGIYTVPVHALTERRAIKDWIETSTQRYPEPSGQLDYLKATDMFTVARTANPAADRPVKHALMALAEQNRWEELRSTATARIAAMPEDAMAWLGLGLAAHRLGDYPRATEAFDRALSLLPPHERARYTGISRILGPRDSVAYVGYSDREREQFDRTYWTAADPLSLTADNEHRLEFLARIAFAELRWTSEDFELRGADTDRGQIYVRYGPPPEIIAMPPAGSGAHAGSSLVLWYYPIGNLHFVFRQPPSYGTATFEFNYHEIAREARFVAPVTWTNVPVTMSIDSVPVQVVRFRGPGDSSDVALFAHLPVRRLLTGLDLTSGTVDVGLTLYRGALEIVERDSMRQTVNVAQPDAAERRTWRRRFAPGELGYRVEALQAEGGRAARALGSVRLTNDRGFGISDVLVADRVAPRADSAARWTDLIIDPNAGVLRRGDDIGVAWESYALTERRGQVRYRVELALTVLELTRGTQLTARVIGGIADLIGISGKGEDRVSLSYERTRAAMPAVLDYLTLDLADAPAGRYRLTIAVTDLETNERAMSARELRIEP
ncbi:MAG TPA: GWxTD domain-containing protein [Gemmatimonadaceae bacterium]|nr:GWxTD domain-containing protein [Gemmatimonadaceae bacterium]